MHVRIGNRPSDLAALIGIWLAGAVAVPVHVAAAAITVERLDDGEVSPYLTEERQVGDELPLPGQQPLVFAPQQRAPDVRSAIVHGSRAGIKPHHGKERLSTPPHAVNARRLRPPAPPD